jgi:hypothetical protein
MSVVKIELEHFQMMKEAYEKGKGEGAIKELKKIRKGIVELRFKRIKFGEYLPVSKVKIVKYIDKRLKELEGVNKK